MAKEFDILQQASEIVEQAWSKLKGGENMAALQEIDTLLGIARQLVTDPEVANGRVVEVARLDESASLVLGMFSYQRRVIGQGRLLTPDITRQPVWAVKKGDVVTPLAYAEDVVGHPLRDALIGQLETRANCQPGGLPR